jgi:hypothetical protein
LLLYHVNFFQKKPTMKKILFGATAMALLATACKKEAQLIDGKDSGSYGNLAKTTVLGIDTIGGVVESGETLHLSSDTLYYLNAKLFIKDGGTLTIDAGTRIEGIKKSTPQDAVAIVVTRGGKIYSNGTANKPVIMTAQTYPNAVPGDWGGVVLLGKAPNNQPTNPVIEGIDGTSVPAGVDINYGGNLPNDNSGVITYTRIEYAGALVSPNNELNGLTCGSVGNGTTLSHIETIYGADDGYEWFGGNVNSDHLVSYANNDDLFDFDFGFTGRLQFCVGVINSSVPYSANPNGIESDNDAAGSSFTPRTQPSISNMTLIGQQTKAQAQALHLFFGNQWRRNTSMILRNSLVMGYDTCINLTSAGTIASGSNPANIKANVLQAFTAICIGATLGTTNKQYIVPSANQYDATASHILLANPFPAAPNALITGLEPKASFLKTGANFAGLAGFQVVPFKGAVGNFADNWLLENWVDFTP